MRQPVLRISDALPVWDNHELVSISGTNSVSEVSTSCSTNLINSATWAWILILQTRAKLKLILGFDSSIICHVLALASCCVNLGKCDQLYITSDHWHGCILAIPYRSSFWWHSQRLGLAIWLASSLCVLRKRVTYLVTESFVVEHVQDTYAVVLCIKIWDAHATAAWNHDRWRIETLRSSLLVAN